MEPQQLLYLILIFVILDFVFDQLLDFINLKYQKKDIPSEVASFYDKDKYLKSLDYQRINTRFGFITATLSFIISVAMLYYGGFGYIDQWLRPHIDNDILLSLVFFAILFIASDIITTPFQWYRTFVIEEKFGFNTTTPGIFIADKFKGYLLTIIIGGLLGSVLIWLIINFGEYFWIYFWAIATVFIVFLQMFYATLIMPLFNKLTPLEEGTLKEAIVAYCRKVDFPLTNIFVIDGSKRSKKANAFFMGFGKKKKVVLYDTLIQNHETEELVAILAHEVGHYKKKHIISGLVLSILQIGFTLFIFSLFAYNKTLSLALGAEEFGIHLSLIAFGILYSPISKALGIVMNMYSRKNEYEADDFARTTFEGHELQNALKKLSVDNLSNLFPHPAYVFVHYSHPPLLQRLEALEQPPATD